MNPTDATTTTARAAPERRKRESSPTPSGFNLEEMEDQLKGSANVVDVMWKTAKITGMLETCLKLFGADLNDEKEHPLISLMSQG